MNNDLLEVYDSQSNDNEFKKNNLFEVNDINENIN